MAYTTIKKPSDYFNTKLFVGSGNTQSITGVGFQPDWIWFKNRTDARAHALVDSIRGTNKVLQSESSVAESTTTAGRDFESFDSDGFTVNNPLAFNSFNESGDNIVAWNWKAGTSFTNDASSTGIGTIDSTGSFNNDAGFSIVSYVGTGSAGTIKHGLNSAPTVIFAKDRESTQNWQVYHSGLGAANRYLELNSTAAYADGYAHFGGTAPTSSVFSLGAVAGINANGNNSIAYCFAEKKGFSKFGSYTGNGSADGPFIYTGFKPSFLLIKRTDAAYHWYIHDNKRNPFNVMDKELYPSQSSAEGTAVTKDFLSNGIKIRGTQVSQNASGGTYIYMAFAEEPLVGDNPATAR